MVGAKTVLSSGTMSFLSTVVSPECTNDMDPLSNAENESTIANKVESSEFETILIE